MKQWMGIICLSFFLLSCPSVKPSFEAPTVYFNDVPIVYEQSINQTKYMSVHNRLGAGIAILYWNDKEWSEISPNVKYFIFFHEICHLNIPTEDQTIADCCSLKVMNSISILSDIEIVEIMELFIDTERQIQLLLCFESLQNNKTN